jgi:hypothetical protein
MERTTRGTLVAIGLLLCVAAGCALAAGTADPRPVYAGDKLVRPEGYREWVYLSTGLGMNYGAGMGVPELFGNFLRCRGRTGNSL